MNRGVLGCLPVSGRGKGPRIRGNALQMQKRWQPAELKAEINARLAVRSIMEASTVIENEFI